MATSMNFCRLKKDYAERTNVRLESVNYTGMHRMTNRDETWHAHKVNRCHAKM